MEVEVEVVLELELELELEDVETGFVALCTFSLSHTVVVTVTTFARTQGG